MARARRGVAGWEKKSDTPQREYKSVSFVLESADENTGEFSGYMQNGSQGLKSFSISDVSWTFDKSTPAAWLQIVNLYRRY